LIKNFIKEVLIDKKIKSIGKYISKKKKITNIKLIFKEFEKRGLNISYDEENIILGDGDYVLSVCRGRFLNKQVYYYDFFQIKENIIVDHWDAMDDKIENHKFSKSKKNELYLL